MNKKILRWNFILQYGLVLTNIFNSILLLPLYLKHIDATTLGIWLATGNILGWMTLVDPGVGEVLQQRIAEARGKGQQVETEKLIGSGFISSGVIFLFGLLIGVLCYFFVGRIINKNISDYSHLPLALFLTVIATGMSLVSFGVSGINQGLHNSAGVAISSITGNFLFLGVNLFFLFTGWGVMSIAAANLARALYVNGFNLISMLRVLKTENLRIVVDKIHFRKFVRIFSFTSASKIITGLSYSIDMIVLARYISPAIITMYEINKRPINITYGLIGRHSVALMPLISHAQGSGDKESILLLVNKQFRFYCYAALFTCFIFIFNYENLIALWTSKKQFAGHLIVNLLVASMFFSLISYFIAIVGYALGDIKMNSLYNIIRNIVFGLCMFFAASRYGVIGTIMVSLVITLIFDVSFYSWRLHKLGYLDWEIWKNIFSMWIVIIPACFIAQWGITTFIDTYIPASMYFIKLLTNGVSFTVFFVALVLLTDKNIRRTAFQIMNSVVPRIFYKKISA